MKIISKKKSIEDIKRKCKEWNIECLEEKYINNKTKMKFKCICNEIFETTWNFLSSKNKNKYCPKCNGRIMWDIKKIKKKCREFNIECLDDCYVNSSTNMIFKCVCGNTFGRTWNTIMEKHSYTCISCSQGTVWSIDTIRQKCEEKNIECLSEYYLNTNVLMSFKCYCGKMFTRRWGDIFRRNHYCCNSCLGRIKWDINSIKNKCHEMDVICLSNHYVKIKEKLCFRCKCGEIFERSWEAVLRQQQILCNKCAKILSKGERIILKYLEDNEFIFKQQYKLNECKSRKKLPFDFAIFDKNNILKTLIEFDGEQHYMPKFNITEREFLEIQKRDKIKTQYCLNNNISLLRIPYWDIDNIENILEKTLKNN